MKIEGIVVSCYRLDLEFTRICVASIRHWYPRIPIWLLKDRHYGDFNTRELERHWNVQIHEIRRRSLGWGFGKLEIITELPARRILVIDSDIVFAGRVMERLERFDEDMVVHREDYAPAAIEEQFFPPDTLRQLDPGFEFQGYGFNTGQIVATTGRIAREDFEALVDWEERKVRHPQIFKMGEQGVLNYVAQRKAQAGKLTLRREPFMVWPGEAAKTNHIHVADFDAEGRHQQLIHWAGLRWGRTPAQMPRSDILLHFEGIYYNGVSFGSSMRRLRRARSLFVRRLLGPAKTAARRLMPRPNPRPAQAN